MAINPDVLKEIACMEEEIDSLVTLLHANQVANGESASRGASHAEQEFKEALSKICAKLVLPEWALVSVQVAVDRRLGDFAGLDESVQSLRERLRLVHRLLTESTE